MAPVPAGESAAQFVACPLWTTVSRTDGCSGFEEDLDDLIVTELLAEALDNE